MGALMEELGQAPQGPSFLTEYLTCNSISERNLTGES
jgi:hypothetical protein